MRDDRLGLALVNLLIGIVFWGVGDDYETDTDPKKALRRQSTAKFVASGTLTSDYLSSTHLSSTEQVSLDELQPIVHCRMSIATLRMQPFHPHFRRTQRAPAPDDSDADIATYGDDGDVQPQIKRARGSGGKGHW